MPRRNKGDHVRVRPIEGRVSPNWLLELPGAAGPERRPQAERGHGSSVENAHSLRGPNYMVRGSLDGIVFVEELLAGAGAGFPLLTEGKPRTSYANRAINARGRDHV